MGRRELQKQKRRAAMLAAAHRLFERQGYARTTFDEIAAAAVMGVATVYKYFSSKEGIVVELLEPDLDRIVAAAQKVIDRLPPDPAKAMIQLMAAYADVGGRNWASRELLRLTVFPGLQNDGLITQFVHKADALTQGLISELLRRQQVAGRLSEKLPIDDATAIIFALLNQHFGMFLFEPGSSYRRTFAQLSRRIRLVFADWGVQKRRRPA